MLEAITFNKDWRNWKKGETVEFRPDINLLVGDQGSGKSSLIQAICEFREKQSEYARRIKFYISDIERSIKQKSTTKPKMDETILTIKTTDDKGINIGVYDFEKDNLRTLSYFKEGCTGVQIAMKFMSHGQANMSMLEKLHQSDIGLYIMDEPDTALSIKSIYKLIDILKKTQNQLILAVHNPILISSVNEVYSVEHRQWMKSENFIKECEKCLDKN